MRAALVLLVAWLCGCATAPSPPSGTAPGPLAAAPLAPSDATWPAADGSNVSDLYPLALRLEARTPVNASLVDASLALDGTVLPTTTRVGSASWGPGPPRSDVLSFDLQGGLRALERVDASLVEHRRVTFAGRDVLVPTLARNVTLVARYRWPGGDATQPLTLATRDAGLADKPFYNRTFGVLALLPHPGGNVHTLEDGAFVAWAAGERVVAPGPNGEPFDAPHPPTVDLLFVTGLGGGVLRVADEPGAPPFRAPSRVCERVPWNVTLRPTGSGYAFDVAGAGLAVKGVLAVLRWGPDGSDAPGFTPALADLPEDGWSYHDAPPVGVVSTNDALDAPPAAWRSVDLWTASGEFLGGTPRCS